MMMMMMMSDVSKAPGLEQGCKARSEVMWTGTLVSVYYE